MQTHHLVSALQELYLELKKKASSGFSQRAFARQLGLSSAELSEFLRGKRAFSEKKIKEILKKLPIKPHQRAELYGQIFLKSGSLDGVELEEEVFSYISDPVYFTMLQLLNAPKFQSDLDWLSEKLNISVIEVRKVLIRLQSIGLIEKCPDKGYRRKYASVKTKDDVTSAALKSHHLNDLETIKESILSVPIDKRDISSLTFLFDSKHMAEAKEILRRAQDEIEALSRGENSNDVYKVSTYLYPVTRLE